MGTSFFREWIFPIRLNWLLSSIAKLELLNKLHAQQMLDSGTSLAKLQKLKQNIVPFFPQLALQFLVVLPCAKKGVTNAIRQQFKLLCKVQHCKILEKLPRVTGQDFKTNIRFFIFSTRYINFALQSKQFISVTIEN